MPAVASNHNNAAQALDTPGASMWRLVQRSKAPMSPLELDRQTAKLVARKDRLLVHATLFDSACVQLDSISRNAPFLVITA